MIEHYQKKQEFDEIQKLLRKSKGLMQQCKTLEEYVIYVDKVRKYAACMELSEAVNRAVEECISENVLRDYLTKYRAEAIQVSIFEYDEEKEMKLIREAEREMGEEQGIKRGQIETEVRMIRAHYLKGKATDEIANFLVLDQSFITEVIALIEEEKMLTDGEIAVKLIKKFI